MTTFHRLTVPSYTGGLPSGYDYVNNALSGTPAFADNAKVGGPNAGTYFVAFGEDATSSDANRANQALAQNTDTLDNLLHRDLALPVRTSDVGPTSSPTTTITLTGPGIFLGGVGDQLIDLFRITDQNDNDIENGSTQVLVASISGGTLGGGFSTGNVTLNLNTSIPTGLTYHVYYSTQSNLATLPADAFISMRIRSAVAVDAEIETLFQLLHGNGEAWNGAWDSTIWDLTAGGLDARYRRSTTGVAGPFNTAGSGGTITRDGPSPATQSILSVRAQPDEFLSAWTAHLKDLGAARSAGTLGSWGFVADGHRWQTAGETASSASLGGFLSVWRRDAAPVASAPVTGLGYWTFLPPGITGTVTALSTGQYQLVLDATNNPYFWKVDTGTTGNPKRSALAIGQDLLSLTVGGVQYAVSTLGFVTSDVTARTIHISALDGGNIPNFNPGPVTATSITWISPLFYASSGAAASKNSLDIGGSGYSLPPEGLFSVVPPPVVDVNTTDGSFHQYTPSSANYVGLGTTDDANPTPAFVWGAYNSRVETPFGAQWMPLGSLLNNGNVVANGYQHSSYNIGLSGSYQTLTLNCAEYDTFYITVSSPSTISSIVLNGLSNTTFPHIRVIFSQSAAPAQITSAAAWPSTVSFSSLSTPFLTDALGAFDVFELDVLNPSQIICKHIISRGFSGKISAQNWKPQVTWSGGGSGPYSLTWNDAAVGPSAQSWLFGSLTTGAGAACQVFYGGGDDTTWTQVGGNFGIGATAGPISSLAVDSAGTIWAAVVVSGTTVGLGSCPAGGSFSSFSYAGSNLTDFQVVSVGSLVMGAIGSSSAAAASLVLCNTGSLTTGLSGLTAQTWSLRSNGSLAVAVAQPDNQTVYTSVFGTSWVATNIQSLVGVGSNLIDTAWNPAKARFLLCVRAGGHDVFYTSPDGVVWTATGASLESTTTVALACVGDTWVGLSASGNNVQVIYSTDGVRWFSTGSWLYGSGSNIPRLQSSPSQFGALLGELLTSTATTEPYRFSYKFGDPDSLLT